MTRKEVEPKREEVGEEHQKNNGHNMILNEKFVVP